MLGGDFAPELDSKYKLIWRYSMEWFQQLATHLPIVFGLMITMALFLFSIASFILGSVMPGGVYGPHIGQILGRLISTLIFVFILWRFGWLTAAGFARSGRWQSWLPILLLMVYTAVAAIYAYAGDFRFDFSKPKLVGVVTLSMMIIGLVEETAYRGVVMYSFVRLWGDSRWGIVGSVLLSALFFGASHIIWVAFGKPAIQSTLMSLSAFQAGIYYGAFVLTSGSIWPTVVFHGLVGAAVNVKLIGKPEYKETVSAGVRMVLLNLPVVIYAVYLLWKVPLLVVIPNAP
jgi:membrane protease YdiL (CAAX protease family)